MPERSTTSTQNVPVDKLLEDAEETGHLHLAGRKISIFPPTASSFDLSDVMEMDLSENRFVDLPELINLMTSLERLICYNNVLRTIPRLTDLQSLVHLDLSRNHISELPLHTWRLPLKTLNVSHNRLVSLPEEMSDLASLQDLDASGNEIVALPESLGQLINLRDLNVRRNHLTDLPDSLTAMKLVRLDISVNRISQLPLSMIKMSSLMTLILCNNPLVQPPTSVCIRGRVHIFKYLKDELDRASGKDDVMRRLSKRDSRQNRTRGRESKHLSSAVSSHNPMPRASRTLEEEVASVATRHGLNWTGEKAAKSAASAASPAATPVAKQPERPKQPLMISHDYAVLEPLDGGAVNGDADDATPTSSPTIDRRAPSPEPVAVPAVKKLPVPAVATTAQNPAKVTKTPSTKGGTSPRVASKVAKPSGTTSRTTAPTTTSSTAKVAGKSSTMPHRSGPSKTSPGTTRPSTSPGAKRPLSTATAATATRPSSATAGKKPSPQISRAAAGAKTSPKVPRASGTPSTTSAPRPAAGKKPVASVKPSAQEISAKMTTKRRLEMEWLEKQKEEERRARKRQEELVNKRKQQEQDLAKRNRDRVVQRASMTDQTDGGAAATVAAASAASSTSSPVDIAQQKEERQQREEMMAAAEASRENWKRREKSRPDINTSPPKSASDDSKRSSVASISSITSDTAFAEGTTESSSPKVARSHTGHRSRPASSSSTGSGDSTSSFNKDRQFTVRRVERESKRDGDTLQNIRKLVESVLKVELPENLGDALSDGVILCKLVNQLRPRTVGVIFEPPHRARGGADDGKLSMLKSVKNVDAFIMGCKKMGLDTGLVCSPADILEMKDPFHVYITVRALVNQCSDTQEVFNV